MSLSPFQWGILTPIFRLKSGALKPHRKDALYLIDFYVYIFFTHRWHLICSVSDRDDATGLGDRLSLG